MNTRFNKTLFTTAAIFNVVVALVLYFDAGLLPRLFQVAPVPDQTIWLRMFASVVFLFGVVYYAAGIDLRSNASLIRLGAIAKLVLVFVAPQLKCWRVQSAGSSCCCYCPAVLSCSTGLSSAGCSVRSLIHGIEDG